MRRALAIVAAGLLAAPASPPAPSAAPVASARWLPPGAVRAGETFALIADLFVDGRRESFTVDHGLTLEDCAAFRGFVGADWIFADPAARIVWQTARQAMAWQTRCVAELSV